MSQTNPNVVQPQKRKISPARAKTRARKRMVQTILYMVIELLFILSIVLFLTWIKSTYSFDVSYEKPIFSMLVFTIVSILLLIPAPFNRIVGFILPALVALYGVAQHVYYDAFHTYFRFNTAMSLANEVTGASESVMEFIHFDTFVPFIVLILIILIFTVIYFLLQRKRIKRIIHLYHLIAFLPLILVWKDAQRFDTMLETARHSEDEFQVYKTDYYIYETIPNNIQFVDTFGLYTFAYRDVQSLTASQLLSGNEREEIATFLTDKPQWGDNEMSGIFKDKNILIVQAESFIDCMADPELTPTIWRLKTQGIDVRGFDTPTLPASTSDSEFMANTSLIPNSDGYAVCYRYVYNTFPTTLATLFNSTGYGTLAIHNNYGDYYNRENLFPNLGYIDFFDCTDLSMMDEASDSQVMSVLKYIITSADYKNMTFWITYSGHQPYDYGSVGVSQENVDRILAKYPNLDESYVAYLAKNMDLDQALNDLISELERIEQLDDMVIVFYGDHMVKGLEFGMGANYYTATGQTYDHVNRDTGLYIYNPTIEPRVVNMQSTALDILPTLANLFGIDYDHSTVLGRDIFDPSYHGFTFSEWDAWTTNDYSYDFIKDTYNLNGYDQQSAQSEMAYYIQMQDISANILKLDYFKPEE